MSYLRSLQISCTFFAVLLLSATGSLGAQQSGAGLNLAWAPNLEEDIAEYRVYVGTSSRQYSAFHSAGSATSLRVAGLIAGRTYYFAVTAVNTAGLESGFSSEVSSVAPTELDGSFNGANLVINVNSVPGTAVTIESSTNLRDWTYHSTTTPNSSGQAQISTSSGPQGPVRFFRARLQ
jgi:fibronectin type 3 domain-containing protein